ncbi:hypothetical protein SY83_07655 [Paenibacillus swuensis]|uniref:AraC family transcriptional regulator n=1 Tax=Paenibacillus swuensis TaxID=1178515 RepID=A0A172TGI5_9BACL|nr:helix-turn-helix domain-containing protein [Paenibacillus swuensis]ANE46165.1 hypothetical protein SY83_07655 [Paenibacillus swuensis]
MYNLLIVDDEIIAVKAIAKGLDWSGLPIASIHEAYDYDEAAEVLRTQPIDLLITDIEMPGKDGLELLDYANSVHPHLVSIITTGHANFDYAHRAIQYGSMHYLLKPLDYNELKALITSAVTKISEHRNIEQFYVAYDQYQKQRDQQLPLLRERFWQDLVNQRILLTPDRIEAAATLYEIPVSAQTRVLPVLISVEQWYKELTTRDEEIMEYALRNAASEIILGSYSGQVLQERSGSNLVLFFFESDDDYESPHSQLIYEQCKEYVKQCAAYFHCSLSCYLGVPSPLQDLSLMFRKLVETEKDNVVRTQSVLFHTDTKEESNETAALHLPDFKLWGNLLETGMEAEFKQIMQTWFEQTPEEKLNAKTLKAFYSSFIHMIYQVLAVRGIRHQEIPTLSNDTDAGVTVLRSVHSLHQWSSQLAGEYLAWIRIHAVSSYSVCVAEAIAFIESHLEEELSREQIADEVHLNSAYLSRLFKKETGLSLSDYIMNLRMEKAKLLLREPHIKISQAASAVGYTHFSHFAKMFKRIIGQTPQEYRKGFLNRD